MSIIVAVKREKQLAIAADSLFNKGSLLLKPENLRNHKKIHQHLGSYIGVLGAAVNHNILSDILVKYPKLLRLNNVNDIFESMNALHPILKEKYFINTSSEEGETAESSQLDMLVVNNCGIFEVENHREVNQYERFWAIGSGACYSLGALEAMYDRLESIEELATAAIEVACKLDAGCGLPLTMHLVSE